MLWLCLFLGFNAFADDAVKPQIDYNPHFTHAEPDLTSVHGTVETHESIVEVGGVQFRQIEYNGAKFYINSKQPDTHVNCGMIDLPPDSFAIKSAAKITQRTRAFIETLRQTCPDAHGGATDTIVSAPAKDLNLGIETGGPNPTDQQKKIYVNPVKKSVGAGLTF